ncbi:MAG: hypothetical protein M1839_000494 [Geoglossum umbratile]|nr:MAG: hypothetical protein M1839_000494 [Geoglossum umbratile]
MAHEAQFITNTGAWVPEVHLQDPEQTEMVSDGALLPAIQWNGNIVPRDVSDDEINDIRSLPTSSLIMTLGAGCSISHMPDYNGEAEDLSRIVDVTSEGQMLGMGQPTAFTPRIVAAAEASRSEGPDPDVVLRPGFPLVLTYHTRHSKRPPPAGVGQHSEQEWEQMRPIIRRMYLGEGKILHDVMDNMDLVYHFKASEKMYKSRFTKWGFAKNSKGGGGGAQGGQHHITAPRQRQKRPLITRGPTKSLVQRRPHFPAASTLVLQSPNRYRHQELTFHCVQNYISALFQSRGWMADMFDISPPAGTADQSAAWRHIEDQCFGVSVLIQSSSMKHAFQTLDRVFQSLKSLAASCDPSIMVEFWPMCRRLYGICVDINNYQLLYEFFRYFRELTKYYFGTKHPVFLLLDALSHVEWDAMISTLRVGYLKSIHCMESVIGTDHAKVLSMWSNYIKYWDKQGLPQAIFIANFTRLLAAAEARFGKRSAKAVSVLHSFTYAAFYNFNDQAMSRRLANNLLERAREIPHINNEYQWGLESQAFAFASKVLALLSLQENQRDESRAYLMNAISCLENGDRECKTRAVMLAQELEGWLASWNDTYSAAALRHRRLRLLSILSDNK